jgi:hypothetical protein
MVVDWDHSCIDEWNSVKHIHGWNGGQYPTLDELRLNLCKSDFHGRLDSLPKMQSKIFNIVWPVYTKKLQLFAERGRDVKTQYHSLLDVDVEDP